MKKLAIAASVVTATVLMGAGISGCNRGGSAKELMADALQFQQKGDIKAATIQLKNAVAKSPEDGEVRMALAGVYNQTGDAVSAEKEVRKAISLGIDRNRALPELAK
ncbi:MAG TPA: tetratricopeptide repeat protein, partial [Telluria sp.]|nr:tetratricopeptide repeat protein [Telluria sp.]